jgi:prepilin peptidase CpaA
MHRSATALRFRPACINVNREYGVAMHLAVLVIAVATFAVIAYKDVRSRRIPNALSLTIAALGLARIAIAEEVFAGAYTLAAAAMVFAVTFALFRCGAFGGGDAKIIPATVLLIGYQDLLGFLFLMSLCGGLLALVTLAEEKLALPSRRLQRAACLPAIVEAGGRAAQKRSTVPYGVAVATAGAITLMAAR